MVAIMDTYVVEVYDSGETYFDFINASSVDEAYMNISADPLYLDPVVVSIKKL